jgi:hypothetical protein
MRKRDNLGDLGVDGGITITHVYVGTERESLLEYKVDGRKIIRWIFRKEYVGVWNGKTWLRIWRGGGHI